MVFPGDRVVFLEPADEIFAEACRRLTDVAENRRLEFVEREIFDLSPEILALETQSSSASPLELLEDLMKADVPSHTRPEERRGRGGGGGCGAYEREVP